MEIWKDLIYQGKDYGYRFEVSTRGNIRNKITGTHYKLHMVCNGYFGVSVFLGSGKGMKTIRVHKAVAETFIPNPENKPEVNHIDGNKQNNCIENLEWTTKSENMQHAVKYNLVNYRVISGENNKSHKLTSEDVSYIREHYIPRHKEFGCRALAKKFNVHHKTITQIINNRTWKNKLN